jgi:3-oxoacyl-(acyl-carrier-protein) synthase
MIKVVVTGVGAVTPVGNTASAMWESVVNGHSGVGPITHFDASTFATQIAAEVKNFSPAPYLSRKEARRLDPLIHFAVSAAGQAIQDAQLDSYPDLDRSRVGILIGSGIGGMKTMIDQHNKLCAKGPRTITPFFIPAILSPTCQEGSSPKSIGSLDQTLLSPLLAPPATMQLARPQR